MELEYLVVRLDWTKDQALTAILNAHAHDGWKVIGFSAVPDELVFVLERPKRV